MSVRPRLRPERHFVDSFITIRLALARAIARWLPRWPLCHRSTPPTNIPRQFQKSAHDTPASAPTLAVALIRKQTVGLSLYFVSILGRVT